MPYYTSRMANYMRNKNTQDEGHIQSQSVGVSAYGGRPIAGVTTAPTSASSSSSSSNLAAYVTAINGANSADVGKTTYSINTNTSQKMQSSKNQTTVYPNSSDTDADDATYHSRMTNVPSIYSTSDSSTPSGVGSVNRQQLDQQQSAKNHISTTVSINLRENAPLTNVSSKPPLLRQTKKSFVSASTKVKSRASRASQRNRSQMSNKSKRKRMLRITPSCVDFEAAGAISRFNPEQHMEGMTFDDKRLTYMKNLLRLQVDRIQRMEGAIPSTGKPYSKYRLELDNPVKSGNQCTMFRAHHVDFPNVPMVVMVYDHITEVVPNPFYLKILRHLGKKHPFILQTWEIFVDENERTLVIQEFANRNDLGTYLAKKGTQSEMQVCEWAHQLYKALDYLGDMAICHRNLKPRRVLLIHKELGVRLTGFYDSVIYWNVNTEDILNFPCIPLSKKPRDAPDFQAPEVYGNPAKEEFDPVTADVWSYGAIIYFMVTQSYPYNFTVDNPLLEEEIQCNVNRLSITEDGKGFLMPLLTTNAMLRLTFERIGSHPWFSQFRQVKSTMGSFSPQ